MNPLETLIRQLIVAQGSQGSLSLEAYMELALQHPLYGYYRVRHPVGREGDFITAPEVSQMFGEMIGVWAVEAWRKAGKPAPFALLELGAGRGTLLRDLLRATAHVGGFHAALQLYLLESSGPLKAEQEDRLAPWHAVYLDTLDGLPPLPTFILANEFFDALPIRQFEKTFQGWAERRVGLVDDNLAFVLEPLGPLEGALISEQNCQARVGSVIETAGPASLCLRLLARHLCAYGGAMLLIDYGYVAPSFAPTLQAVSRHAAASIFDRPGEVDLTAHVDFTALIEVARAEGLSPSPVVGQGEFLRNLGIEIRADALKARATSDQAAVIDAALHRLTAPDQMGELFKVVECRVS